jgi:hypothetical protein|tara:strand:- start:1366 stop:1893 length:528 start_codon:yes stop_codon:yes gene_type:complete
MYFENFPLIPYDSVGNGNFKLVTNLLKRVAVRSKVKINASYYDTYDVKEGETPEMIADKLYDDPELHWVILLLNDITDRYHQWPKNQNQFLAYVNDKYSNVDSTHHYEISQVSGDTTIKIDIGTDNTDYPAASIVTNFEHEEDLQDKKRKIRLLDPSYVEDFVAEFEKLMGESIL